MLRRLVSASASVLPSRQRRSSHRWMSCVSGTHGWSQSVSASFAVRRCFFSSHASPSRSPITNALLACTTDLPRFGKIAPEDVEPAMEHLLDKFHSELTRLETHLQHRLSQSAQQPLTWAEVVTSVEALRDKIEVPWGAVSHLMHVRASDKLRGEYAKVQPKMVMAGNRLNQSQTLYEARKALFETAKPALSQMQTHYLKMSLKHSVLGGVSLSSSDKEKFNAISAKLAELANTFSQNVIKSSATFAFVLADRSQVEGLSPAVLEMLASNERQAGNPHATSESGPWRIIMSPPCITAVMENCANRGVRKALQYAVATRSSDVAWDAGFVAKKDGSPSSFNNLPLIGAITQLKQEMASLLGFKTYTELSLATKMAPSVDAVCDMLFRINDKARTAAQKEMKALEQLFRESAQATSEGPEAKLSPWDVAYFMERDAEKSLQFNQEELRPYLVFDRVLRALFDLCSKLFSISIEPVAIHSDFLWNEHVRFYQVRDIKSKQVIAGFFLDPFSRPSEKQGGAWMDIVVSRSAGVFQNCSPSEQQQIQAAPHSLKEGFSIWSVDKSGAADQQATVRRLPVAHLVCNQSAPHPYPGVKENISLMTWGEVETLFHEFGHGLQHMLSVVDIGDISGVNGVEWDAVELPSQFMEQWCSLPSVLATMVEHVQTKETKDVQELSKTLLRVKTHMGGILALNQVRYSILDLVLHGANVARSGSSPAEKELTAFLSTFKHPLSESDVLAIQAAVTKHFSVLTPIAQDRFLCSFNHIFGGGYSAGYYSYKWAEILCFDAFDAFKSILEDVSLSEEQRTAQLALVGDRFRRTVLASGGSAPALEVFKAFRGREPSLEPFFTTYFGGSA